MDGVLCLPDRIRSNPLLKGNGDQERLPFALNEAIAETMARSIAAGHNLTGSTQGSDARRYSTTRIGRRRRS
jgi:hypothetical protein